MRPGTERNKLPRSGAIDLSLVSERSPPGRGGLPPPARPDVQGLQVVADLLVLRILRLGLRKILAGAAQVAAQKVRVAAVVEEFRRRADQLEGLDRVPWRGVAGEGHHDPRHGRAGQAATAGRLTNGSSLIGAIVSRVM